MTFPIVTYTAAAAPDGYAHIALLIFPGARGPNNAKGSDTYMVFRAESEQAARAKADTFIADEMERQRRIVANRAAAAEKRRKVTA